MRNRRRYAACVNIDPVDERDSSWEDHRPRFRVYLFAGPRPTSYTTSTFDVTDADALQVLRWAQDQAGTDRLYSVALVRDGDLAGTTRRGLVWLVGMDANDTSVTPREAASKDAMRRRLGRTIVNDG
jgi:hypothetical protein